jgi:hypothetical protein
VNVTVAVHGDSAWLTPDHLYAMRLSNYARQLGGPGGLSHGACSHKVLLVRLKAEFDLTPTVCISDNDAERTLSRSCHGTQQTDLSADKSCSRFETWSYNFKGFERYEGSRHALSQ